MHLTVILGDGVWLSVDRDTKMFTEMVLTFTR